MSAVIEYLNWLGNEVQQEVADEISEYTGRRRILKAALSWIRKYEQTLSRAMLSGAGGMEGLTDMKDVEFYGSRGPERTDQRAPTFTFNIIGADPHKVAQYLWDKHAIALLAENAGGFYSRTLKTYGKTIGVRGKPRTLQYRSRDSGLSIRPSGCSKTLQSGVKQGLRCAAKWPFFPSLGG